MARLPSMTVEQAEAELGPRGSLRVTSENRRTVRKWLTAQGFPALFVAGLSMKEMALAYNQTDGAGLDAIKRKLAEIGDNEEAMAWQNQEANADEDATPVSTPVAKAVPDAHDATAIGLLRELLLSGYKPGIDENQVRAIVQDAIAGIAPRVIEVRHQDKEPIRIEGIVHPEFERALGYLQDGNNVMFVGPAGCGKSHMCKQLAKALGVDFGMISGSTGASESELKGWLLPTDGGKFEYAPSEFVRLYERGNAAWCFDEIDAFDSNMLMVANVPLANGHLYVQQRRENPVITRGPNFYFMATANTYGTGANPLYVGRNPMDEATRDRFMFIEVDYDKRLEESIAAAGGLSAAEMAGIWELRDRCREAQLTRVISTRAFQKAASMKRCGDSWREIRDRLLIGWNKDEKAKVGV